MMKNYDSESVGMRRLFRVHGSRSGEHLVRLLARSPAEPLPFLPYLGRRLQLILGRAGPGSQQPTSTSRLRPGGARKGSAFPDRKRVHVYIKPQTIIQISRRLSSSPFFRVDISGERRPSAFVGDKTRNKDAVRGARVRIWGALSDCRSWFENFSHCE
jgi:hypothetical protein